MRMENNYKSQN